VREEKRHQNRVVLPLEKVKNSNFHFCLFSLGIWSEMKARFLHGEVGIALEA
jgi:hypothetical protein